MQADQELLGLHENICCEFHWTEYMSRLIRNCSVCMKTYVVSFTGLIYVQADQELHCLHENICCEFHWTEYMCRLIRNCTVCMKTYVVSFTGLNICAG